MEIDDVEVEEQNVSVMIRMSLASMIFVVILICSLDAFVSLHLVIHQGHDWTVIFSGFAQGVQHKRSGEKLCAECSEHAQR